MHLLPPPHSRTPALRLILPVPNRAIMADAAMVDMEAMEDTEAAMEDMVAMVDTGLATEVMEDMVDTEAATTDRTMEEDMAAMVDTGPMVAMDTTAKLQNATMYLSATPTLPPDMTRNFTRTLATLMPVAFPSDTSQRIHFVLINKINLII